MFDELLNAVWRFSIYLMQHIIKLLGNFSNTRNFSFFIPRFCLSKSFSLYPFKMCSIYFAQWRVPDCTAWRVRSKVLFDSSHSLPRAHAYTFLKILLDICFAVRTCGVHWAPTISLRSLVIPSNFCFTIYISRWGILLFLPMRHTCCEHQPTCCDQYPTSYTTRQYCSSADRFVALHVAQRLLLFFRVSNTLYASLCCFSQLFSMLELF